jgi:uncharacterized protein YbjQ (UPF0145 family)
VVELIIQVSFVLFLLALGLIAGTIAERKHLASLAEREQNNGAFLVTQLKSFPAYAPGSPDPQFVVAEAALSSDYFRTFLASIRRLFGGEMKSFHKLLQRARREATQRVIEQAQELGYNAICNLRLDSADIGGNSKRKGAAMVCIIASATAYRFEIPRE